MAPRSRPRSDDPPDDPWQHYLDADVNNDGNVDSEDIIDMSPDEIRQWLTDNSDILSEGDLAPILQYAQGMSGSMSTTEGGDWAQLAGAVEVMIEEGPTAAAEVIADQNTSTTNNPEVQDAADDQNIFDDSVESASNAAADAILEANGVGATVDQDAIIAAVSEGMPEGLSPSEQDSWGRQVWEAGVLNAQQQAAATQESQGQAPTGLNPSTLPSDLGTPIWLLQATGYGELTDQQQERLVDYVNDTQITNFRSYQELLNSGVLGDETDRSAPSDLIFRTVNAAIAAVEPVEELRIDLPGVRDPIHVSLEDQAKLRDTYGLSTDGIVRLARLGNLQPRLDPNTGQARPVNLMELAAISSAFNMQSGLAARRQGEQDIAALQSELDELTDPDRPEAGSHSEFEARERRIAEIKLKLTSLRRMNSETSGGGPNQPGVMGIYNLYQRGLDQYGQDQGMALIHAVNPALAQRVAQAGRDPDKLEARDAADAWDILINSGVVAANERSGFRPVSSLYNQFNDYFNGSGPGSGGGGGGGGRIRRLIDPEGVKQQVQGLWQGLFLSDAPDEAISGITAALQKSLDNAPPGMEFDVSARIQAWLKGQGQYQELYGKKAPGTSEQDYQAQFLAGSASILGNETADPEAVKSGMRTGEYQTTVGAAFAGGMEGGDNSTLQERLARAANLVAANT